MIQLSGAGKRFGPKILFQDLDWLVTPKELDDLAQRIGETDHAGLVYAQIAERIHRIEAELQSRDGYSVEAEAGAVLNGLGFKKEDWERRTEEFSGGWQMRIALAK